MMRSMEDAAMKVVDNLVAASCERKRWVGEYNRQEPHDENIDQEYNCDCSEATNGSKIDTKLK